VSVRICPVAPNIMITKDEFYKIKDIVFKEDYPGYVPVEEELKDFDVDLSIERSHASIKPSVLDQYYHEQNKQFLSQILNREFDLAVRISDLLKIPKQYGPCIDNSFIRILEYPSNCKTFSHVDKTLFTMTLYRDIPENLHIFSGDEPSEDIKKLNPQIHFGRIAEELQCVKLASYHQAIVGNQREYSSVYFVLPSIDAVNELDNKPGRVPQYPGGNYHNHRKIKRKITK
jgi:hypothetical protein